MIPFSTSVVYMCVLCVYVYVCVRIYACVWSPMCELRNIFVFIYMASSEENQKISAEFFTLIQKRQLLEMNSSVLLFKIIFPLDTFKNSKIFWKTWFKNEQFLLRKSDGCEFIKCWQRRATKFVNDVYKLWHFHNMDHYRGINDYIYKLGYHRNRVNGAWWLCVYTILI